MKKPDLIYWISKLSTMPRFMGSALFHPQSGSDHSFRITMIALVIVDDYNSRVKIKKHKISREEVLMKALFHDIEESVIGDIPTPVKYITPEFRLAVKDVEKKSMKNKVLANAGPASKEYYKLWDNAKKGPSGEIVKIADKLEGFIKINFELLHGNASLQSAYDETEQWFAENVELLQKYPKALELINEYRINK